jgi:hypothetical protein
MKSNIVTVYHGSNQVVEKPVFGEGRKHNDFGLGFYCTENEELAKEWACSSLTDGFSNRYTIDIENFNILRLNSEKYSILNWIAVLVQNRIFRIKAPIASRAKKYLLDNFNVNVNAYDVIIGYRANDAYFDYAETFLNNGLSIGQLSKAMRLGKLGEQFVVKSQYAFTKLKFEGFTAAERTTYYPKRKSRDEEALRTYNKLAADDNINDLYMMQIVREGISNGDARIPRNLP